MSLNSIGIPFTGLVAERELETKPSPRHHQTVPSLPSLSSSLVTSRDGTLNVIF